MTTNNSNWNLDTVHSGINFSVRHMVVSKVRGRFTKFSGNIALDESDLARSVVEATVDASSIDTGTAQRDDHLRSADFFDVERFPQIRFRSAKGAFDRKDFGLKWNQALETGGVLVSDRVEIELEVQGVKAAVAQAA